MLNTVNVIEANEGIICSLRAFPGTPDGNRQAEELFLRLCRENNVVGIDAEAAVEDGIASNGGWTITLVHSESE